MRDNAIKEPVITLSAGPVAVFPRVMQGLSRPVHYDYDPYFQDFYEQVDLAADIPPGQAQAAYNQLKDRLTAKYPLLP